VNEKEHNEQTIGARGTMGIILVTLRRTFDKRLAKAGGECCFILTPTATRAKTRFLNQIGIRSPYTGS
jgi:hypothetical protein